MWLVPKIRFSELNLFITCELNVPMFKIFYIFNCIFELQFLYLTKFL